MTNKEAPSTFPLLVRHSPRLGTTLLCSRRMTNQANESLWTILSGVLAALSNPPSTADLRALSLACGPKMVLAALDLLDNKEGASTQLRARIQLRGEQSRESPCRAGELYTKSRDPLAPTPSTQTSQAGTAPAQPSPTRFSAPIRKSSYVPSSLSGRAKAHTPRSASTSSPSALQTRSTTLSTRPSPSRGSQASQQSSPRSLPRQLEQQQKSPSDSHSHQLWHPLHVTPIPMQQLEAPRTHERWRLSRQLVVDRHDASWVAVAEAAFGGG